MKKRRAGAVQRLNCTLLLHIGGMKMKKKIVLLEILGMFLHMLFFTILYYAGFHISIVMVVWMVYLVPAAVNAMLFWKAVNNWPLKKQFVVFGIMSAITDICYGVFAYFFEANPGYVAYYQSQVRLPADMQVPAEGRFFSVIPFVIIFLFNLSFQFLINGTRREITKEEVDEIFKKYK